MDASGQPATDDFVRGQFQRTAFLWEPVQQRGYAPSPRFGHTFCKGGQLALVYGGLYFLGTEFHVNNNLYFLSLYNYTWKTIPSQLHNLAYHTCTFVGDNTFVLIGGCSLNSDNSMTRPGNIYVVKCGGTAQPENFQVISYHSNLHISNHSGRFCLYFWWTDCR